jgi:hypothetical protein
MGADARLFVFDYELYRTTIVPVFLHLMRDRTAGNLLLKLIEAYRHDLDFPEGLGHLLDERPPLDLAAHCTYLDSELAITRIFTRPKGDYAGSWEARACRCTSCPARKSCPFQLAEDGQLNLAMDDSLRLLQSAIAKRCLGAGQFLGRSVDCFFYWDTLDRLGVAATHPIRLLMERLGRRGFVIGYAGSTGTEGIHGWLNPIETKALAGHLFALDLPDYECSFVAMEGFRTMRNLLEGYVQDREFLGPSYNHPTAPFEELSLSYVRTVCTLAAREDKGVLWGNDVA